MHLQSIAASLFASVALLGVLVDEAFAVETIELQPRMPAIYHAPAPTLNDTDIDDVILTGDTLDMQPPHAYEWIVDPGDPFTLHVHADDPDRGDEALLTVWDWNNRPIAQQSFSIPFDRQLTLNVAGRGVYLLTLDRLDDSEPVSRLVRNFAVLPDNRELREVWNDGEFFIGAAVYPDRMNWRNELGPVYLEALGLEATAEHEAQLNARLGLQVPRIEMTDAGVQLYRELGFLVHLKVWPRGDVAPQYEQAAAQAQAYRYPRTRQAARDSFRDSARRWADDDALFVQILNEPDHDYWLGTPEEYVEHQSWAYELFKQHNPDLPITAGGYTNIDRDRLEHYVEQLEPVTDWVSFHTHGPLLQSIDNYRDIADLHEQHGHENPVYVNTEMGSRAWRLDRDRQQALDAIHKTFYFWSQGHRGVSYYYSRATVEGPGRIVDGCWGYLDHFMCPRFKYGVINALIETYAGATFDSVLHESDDLHVYRFTRDDMQLITAFRPTGSPADVTFNAPTAPDARIDAMGNQSDWGTFDHQRNMEVGNYPVTLLWPADVEVTVQAEH